MNTSKPGTNLHSRYNPQAEAVRYIDSLKLKETTECFILIEPGLGYIIPVLRERFKESKIIALHVEDFSHNDDYAANAAGEIVSFCGAERQEINKFLEQEVPENGVDRVKIIEWRPSLNFYGEAYLKLLSKTVEFLKRTSAGKRTTAAFGKRWVRNFFKNLCFVNKTILFKQTSLPVIVTGSGPSLEHALPVIANLQNSCLIIAAASSVMALNAHGIKADIVITTDGGSWALKHMIGVTRCNAVRQNSVDPRRGTFLNQDGIIAANLCAALPSQVKNSQFLVISDGSFWQSAALHAFSIPSVIIPQRGTVTATAAELAMILSNGSVYLAGMDLSNNDIRTHVKPYAFDGIFSGEANRFLPVYTACFTRSGLLKEGGSMNIYAEWFKDQSSLWNKDKERIFSLTENKVFKKAAFTSKFPPQETPSKTKNLDEIFSAVSLGEEDYARFYQRGIDAIASAMNDPKFADNIKKELTSLLFADAKNEATKDEILREITTKEHITMRNLK